MIKKVITYLFLLIISIGFAFGQNEVYMFSFLPAMVKMGFISPTVKMARTGTF